MLTAHTNIEARVHRRFLDYLDLHIYFSKKKTLSLPVFVEKDAAYFALVAKGDARDDEEEQLLAELANELHRD